MIFSDDIKEISPLCQSILKAEGLLDSLEIKENLLFSIFLLEEFKKTRYSRIYREFMDMLPASCNNYPVFFIDSETAELNGSPFADIIKQR